jgi:hypothetical protein
VTNFQSRSRHGHELLKEIGHGHGRDRDRDRDYRDSRRSRRALHTPQFVPIYHWKNLTATKNDEFLLGGEEIQVVLTSCVLSTLDTKAYDDFESMITFVLLIGIYLFLRVSKLFAKPFANHHGNG